MTTDGAARLRPESYGELWRAVARWKRSRGVNLSRLGVGLIRCNLADSRESCGFASDLLIRENLADYENLADTSDVFFDGE